MGTICGVQPSARAHCSLVCDSQRLAPSFPSPALVAAPCSLPLHGPNPLPLRPQLGLGRGHGGEEPPVELLLLWAGLWQFFKQTNLSLVALSFLT